MKINNLTEIFDDIILRYKILRLGWDLESDNCIDTKETFVKVKVGDRVIVHPSNQGSALATKLYEGVVVSFYIRGSKHYDYVIIRLNNFYEVTTDTNISSRIYYFFREDFIKIITE